MSDETNLVYPDERKIRRQLYDVWSDWDAAYEAARDAALERGDEREEDEAYYVMLEEMEAEGRFD